MIYIIAMINIVTLKWTSSLLTIELKKLLFKGKKKNKSKVAHCFYVNAFMANDTIFSFLTSSPLKFKFTVFLLSP